MLMSSHISLFNISKYLSLTAEFLPCSVNFYRPHILYPSLQFRAPNMIGRSIESHYNVHWVVMRYAVVEFAKFKLVKFSAYIIVEYYCVRRCIRFQMMLYIGYIISCETRPF